MTRIAIGDISDPRVLDAAAILAKRGEVTPVLVGHRPAAVQVGVEVVTVPDDRPELVALAEYVRDGYADGGVAGSLSTSASVIRAAINNLGTLGLVCGTFVVRHRERWVTYADCSVIPEPDSVQLATIAVAATDLHHQLFGDPPKTALLSFSTAGSARHRAVDDVTDALSIVRAERPDITVDGEMQLDVALDAAVAARKMPGSEVAGNADVLIFPSLEAGNIAYKLAERVGGCRALGSFVLNLYRPFVDLSRGCATVDIVDTVELLAQAASQEPSHASCAEKGKS